MVAASYTALSMIHGHDNYRPSSTAIGGPTLDSTAAKRSGLYHTQISFSAILENMYLSAAVAAIDRPQVDGVKIIKAKQKV